MVDLKGLKEMGKVEGEGGGGGMVAWGEGRGGGGGGRGGGRWEVGGDGGYTSRANVEKMAVRGVGFLGSLADNAGKANGGKDRFAVKLFIYDAEQNCFVCPEGKQLKYEGRQEKDGQTSYK